MAVSFSELARKWPDIADPAPIVAGALETDGLSLWC
jgi:hypothetical protein